MKNILFDLDGTLTDSKIGLTKSIAYALNKFDIEVQNLDELSKFIGPPLRLSLMEYYKFSESDAELGLKYFREYLVDKGLYENTVYEGIIELLIKLKSLNKNLIIATSKPTVHALMVLEYFDLLKYFTFVAGSELDGTRSNKSEVISYALSENNITDIKDVIMIGDRKHDIIGAKTVGVHSIGVLYGYGDLNELEENGADFIVSSVKQLEQVLLKLSILDYKRRLFNGY